MSAHPEDVILSRDFGTGYVFLGHWNGGHSLSFSAEMDSGMVRMKSAFFMVVC